MKDAGCRMQGAGVFLAKRFPDFISSSLKYFLILFGKLDYCGVAH